MPRRNQNTQEEGCHHVDNEGARSAHAQAEDTRGKARTNISRNAGLSYKRPSRDYKASIKWTYEVNKNLYRVFIEADKSQLGYQKRLKSIWDKEHPEMNHLNEKKISTTSKKYNK